MRDTPYKYIEGCQSLLGYGQAVHERSGGICLLCGCGSGEQIDFHLWRQMTVEHLIGGLQGGYLKSKRHPTILDAVRGRFPTLPVDQAVDLAKRIHDLNMVTACHFCNSMTSRDKNPKTMRQLLDEVEGTPDQIIEQLRAKFDEVLRRKKADVQWKLASIRPAFERLVEPTLNALRQVKFSAHGVVETS